MTIDEANILLSEARRDIIAAADAEKRSGYRHDHTAKKKAQIAHDTAYGVLKALHETYLEACHLTWCADYFLHRIAPGRYRKKQREQREAIASIRRNPDVTHIGAIYSDD